MLLMAQWHIILCHLVSLQHLSMCPLQVPFLALSLPPLLIKPRSKTQISPLMAPPL